MSVLCVHCVVYVYACRCWVDGERLFGPTIVMVGNITKEKKQARTKRVLSSKEKPCGSSLCADNSSCTDGEQHT